MTESVSGTELLVTIKPSFILSSFAYLVVGWPSGLRRCVKAAVSSDAWVRIPLLSFFSSQPSVSTTMKTAWINTNQVFSIEFPGIIWIKGGLCKAAWPSGLSRCVQFAVSPDAWVRIPLLSFFSSKTSFSTKLKTGCINGNQVFSIDSQW